MEDRQHNLYALFKMKKKRKTTLSDAIKMVEKQENKKISSIENVQLNGIFPPIEIMDDKGLKNLKHVKSLTLSTNSIREIGNLSPLVHIEILSLGRNHITKIENMNVYRTLKELYISFNDIESLSGLEALKNLNVLAVAQNKIRSWDEFSKLQQLQNLEHLIFQGNPLHVNYSGTKKEWRRSVLEHLPNLKLLDGVKFNVIRVPIKAMTPRISYEPHKIKNNHHTKYNIEKERYD